MKSFAPLLSLLRGAEACTALAVDGAASETGAAFAVENVDCDNCDFRLTYVPAQDYEEGATRPVYLQKAAYPRYVGYDRSAIYAPQEGQAAFPAATRIPQVRHTHGYYESACPLMNDRGLGIAESSTSAMLLNKAPGAEDNRTVPVAILDAAALMQLVLERCDTARCGAELMGQLCEEHGYLPFFGEPTLGVDKRGSEWDDAGEAYTLADRSGEAWVVHVLGGVSGVIKSVWAAQKVPKGHVAVVANEFTIGELPEEPNDEYLFPKSIREAAVAAKLWDGQGAFHFSRVFQPDELWHSAPASSIPDPLYSSLRKWRLLSLFAPSLGLAFNMDQTTLPFSVAVEKKVTRADVMAAMRDHYAGTEFDMTQGMLAGPWGTPFRAEGGVKRNGTEFAQVPRGISILRSIYSTVSETGPEGARVWFAPDTAATSVYMPLDHRTTGLSPIMHTGTYVNFTRESAFWAFDYVSNWMQLNYRGMSTEDVEPRQREWQARIDAELAELSGAGAAELEHWQSRLQERVVADWWQMADELVVKWNDMEKFTEACLGCSWAYPEDWATWVGMSNNIHPLWVQPAAEPQPAPAGYVPATVSLPRGWDFERRAWTDFPKVTSLAEAPAALAAWGLQLSVAAAIFAAGFALGRRSPREAPGVREPLLA